MVNELHHRNCLDVLNDIPERSIDLVITDCPYHVVQGGRVGDQTPMGGIFSECHEGFKNGNVFENNDIEFSEWLPDVYRVLKEGTHAYIMINGRNLCELQNEAEKSGFRFQNLLVWDKGNKTPNRYYMQQCEFVLLLSKGAARNINDMGSGNLFSIPNPVGNKTHPTEKPVKLMRHLIENSSNVNEIILDPFMGTGSSVVAAVHCQRQYIGIELDEKYFTIAKQRVDKAIKNKKILW